MIDQFKTMKRKHRIWFAVLIGFAIIAFWRGVWGLLDLYLFPGNDTLSYIISSVLGFAILVATNYTVKGLE